MAVIFFGNALACIAIVAATLLSRRRYRKGQLSRASAEAQLSETRPARLRVSLLGTDFVARLPP